MSDDFNGAPAWDPALAIQLPGKMLLVGLSYFEAGAEAPCDQQQVFGRVVHADARKGILLSLEGQRAGETFNLPPDTRSFQAATPGEYRLRATGELVNDPDFTVSFAIHKRENLASKD